MGCNLFTPRVIKKKKRTKECNVATYIGSLCFKETEAVHNGAWNAKAKKLQGAVGMCRVKQATRERAQMDVAQLVRLPNGEQVVMGSTPTFHSAI